MRSRVIVSAFLIACTVFGSPVGAAVPSLVNYSGVLTNAGGTPLSGVFSVQFKIYGTEFSSFPFWLETQSVTTDAVGRFNVLLGRVSPIDENVFDAASAWLGITVGSDPQMTPRTQIATAPYAFHVSSIDGATGGKITGSFACGHNQTLAGAGNSNFLAGDSNTASGYASSVAAGVANTASGTHSLVASGTFNQATGGNCVIGGGSQNIAEGVSSVVGGGVSNTAGSTALSNNYATVPGGFSNIASGHASFAAGHNARALGDYSFVWNGDTSLAFNDTTGGDRGQFVVRAPGGVRIYSATHDVGSGVILLPGSGSWTNGSDRNSKDNIRTVDGERLLVALSAIPVSTWNYKAQDPSIRHIGPMSQDFYDAFGVGEDDKFISSVDADGVALAAIQALNEKTKQIDELRIQIAELQQQMKSLMDNQRRE